MKKKLLIAFWVMLAASFVACGKKTTVEKSTTEEITTEVPTTEAPTTETPATEAPTEAATENPTEAPTEAATENPTEAPTEVATEEPTEAPTQAPTEELTEKPTEAPTEAPTQAPTEAPTEESTEAPTEAPTEKPTQAPTETPTQTSSFNPKEDFKPGRYGFAGEVNWEGYTDAIVVYGISFSEEGTIFGYVWGLYVREDDPSVELSSEVYHYNGAKYYRSSSAMLGMDPMIGTYSLTDEAINVEYTYISSTPCSGVFVMTSDKSIKSEEANPIAAAGQELVLYEGN